MSPHLRTVYIAGMIVVFVVLAPLVVIYSLGYRYDVSRQRLLKTGAIALATRPRGGTVFIDGRRLRQTSPSVLRNVLPGEHHISIKKRGYASWNKQLTVYAGKTSVFQDILLLRTRLVAQTLESFAASSWALGPEGTAVAWTDASRRLFVKSVGNGNRPLVSEAGVDAILGFSVNARYVVATAPQSLLIADRVTETLLALPFPDTPLSLRWHQSNDSLVYAITKNGVFEIDLLNSSARTLPVEAFDLLARDATLLSIERAGLNDTHRRLVVYRLPDLTVVSTQDLPDLTDRFLLPTLSPLATTDGHSIRLQHNQVVREYRLDQAVIGAQWSSAQSSLIAWTAAEAWVYDIKQDRQLLITRQPTPIVQAFWVQGWPAVILQTTTTATYQEVDPRGDSYAVTINTALEPQSVLAMRGGRLISGTARAGQLTLESIRLY